MMEAVLHLVKGNLGPGLFAMPLQFALVGPFVGLITLSVVSMQGLYCMWLLVHTQQRANRTALSDEYAAQVAAAAAAAADSPTTNS